MKKKRFRFRRFTVFFVSALLIVIVFSSALPASAEFKTYGFNIARPEVMQGVGYLELATNSFCNILYVTYEYDRTEISVDMQPRFTISSDRRTISLSFPNATSYSYFSVFVIHQNGSFERLYSSVSGSWEYTMAPENALVGVHFYGLNPFSAPSFPDTFRVDYGSDLQSNLLLNQILSAINSQTASYNAIIANDNRNANALNSQIESQTDRFFSSQYPGADTSVTDSYHTAEQGMLDETATGRSLFSSVFDTFRSHIFTGKITKGILAVSNIVNEFIGIPFVGGLLYFSLSLGIIAFLIGMSVLIFRLSRRG